MTLKLTLILISSLLLASTECINQYGNRTKVPCFNPDNDLFCVLGGEFRYRWSNDFRLRSGIVEIDCIRTLGNSHVVDTTEEIVGMTMHSVQPPLDLWFEFSFPDEGRKHAVDIRSRKN